MKSTQQMFNPTIEDYETLKEMMIERDEDLEDILGRLESTSVSGTSRNFVVVGQRGMGKTHFLLLLYHEIKERETLRKKYLSLKFSEEEYSIDSLAFFFIRILEELSKECASSETEERIRDLLDSSMTLDNKQLVRKSDTFLEEFFKKHQTKMVLFADNIDGIFRKISSSENTGLKHLRSILQSKEYLIIIGAAPTFFKEIKNHEEPFYNFFEIIRLAFLSPDGVKALIKKLADMENDTKIIREFETLGPKIKTIVHFTSGIPRLVRMLYYVIANAELIEVADSLKKLLDELTPYYQERMARLSPQQQKIIDTMAVLDGPSTPTEIARAGRIKRATVNAQLKKLSDSGFVHLVQQKKRKRRRYDITERMFRIWREMRRSKTGRVEYLTNFLKAYYGHNYFKEHIATLDDKFSCCLENGTITDARKYIKEYEFIKDMIPKKILPGFELKLVEKYIHMKDFKKAEEELKFIKDFKEKIEPPEEFDEKLYKLEMTNIEKILDEDPEDVSSHIKKGILLFKKKRYDEALEEFEYILKINSKNEDARHWKAISLLNLTRYEEAIEEFEKVLKLNPENEDALFLKGGAFFDLKRYGEAIEEFEKVLKLNLENEDALHLKAISLFVLKRYGEAIEEYEKVLKLNPENEDALRDKGGAFFDLKRYEEAIEEFEKVLKINPKNEGALHLKAISLFVLKRYEEAIEEFEKVLKLNPENEDALHLKAISLFVLKRYEEAIEELEKVLKINPKNEGARHLKAISLLNLKRYGEAIEEFEKVLKINSENEDALYWKGLSYCYLGQYEDAVKNFKEIFKNNSKNEIVLNLIGICYLLGNEYGSFFTWFDQLESTKKQFDPIFKGWEFEYDFERENAMTFLRETVSKKGLSSEFSNFWNDLLNFTVRQILHYSAEDFKAKNFGSATEKVALLFEYEDLLQEVDVYALFLDYLVDLLKMDLEHADEIFDLFKGELGDDFKDTFITLDKTIAYLRTKDEELLEKLFPEEREVVEELISRIEKMDED